MLRNLFKTVTAFALLALALAATGLAAGGSGSTAEHAGVAGTVQGALQTTKTTGSSLPFTGTNLSIFVAIALGLALVGFTMRRAGRQQD
jgi:hypothetical protein